MERHDEAPTGPGRRVLVPVVLGVPLIVAGSSLATGEAPAEDGGFPWLTVTLVALAVVFAALFGARVVAVIDRRTVSWFDAWLKTTVIVAYFTVFTIVLPSLVLQSQAVSALSRTMQDLVGSGTWAVGLGVGLWGLWYAQRSDRI